MLRLKDFKIIKIKRFVSDFIKSVIPNYYCFT